MGLEPVAVALDGLARGDLLDPHREREAADERLERPEHAVQARRPVHPELGLAGSAGRTS